MKPSKLQRTLAPGTNGKIYLALNGKQSALVNELMATGVWGNTPAQVVMRLFDRQLAKQIQHEKPPIT